MEPFNVPIRFTDIDAMGHVNNACYFTYFEEARIYYFEKLLENWDWNSCGIVLAQNHATYHLPLRMTDSALLTMRVTKIGQRSFELTYRIEVNQVLYCSGSSAVVCYNHDEKKTIEIPKPLLDALNTLL